MISRGVTVFPRFDFCNFPAGVRVCVPRLPGCVIVLREEDRAIAVVSEAIKALQEGEIGDPTTN